jgi:hypothetical protein
MVSAQGWASKDVIELPSIDSVTFKVHTHPLLHQDYLQSSLITFMTVLAHRFYLGWVWSAADVVEAA